MAGRSGPGTCRPAPARRAGPGPVPRLGRGQLFEHLQLGRRRGCLAVGGGEGGKDLFAVDLDLFGCGYT